MPDKLIAYGSATNTYMLVFRNSDGKVWDDAGSAWATFADASIGNYDLVGTRLGTSMPVFTFDVPTHANFLAGKFTAMFFSRSGGSPAVSDFLLGTSSPSSIQYFDYDGANIVQNLTYWAKVDVNIDAGNSKDEYTVRWFRNGKLVSPSGTPQIQLIKRVDGTDLLAAANMTQVGSTGIWKYDATTTNRMTAGEAVIAVVTATVDGVAQTWSELKSRDA